MFYRKRLEPLNRVPTDKLSKAELEVLQMAADGLSAAETAKQRWTSKHTVATQRKSLKQKLLASSIAQAVGIGKDKGLI